MSAKQETIFNTMLVKIQIYTGLARKIAIARYKNFIAPV